MSRLRNDDMREYKKYEMLLEGKTCKNFDFLSL